MAKTKAQTAGTHRWHIIWGESPADGQQAATYTFKTHGEAQAFLLGVNEASGWEGFEIVAGTDDVWCSDCGCGHLPGQCNTTDQDEEQGHD